MNQVLKNIAVTAFIAVLLSACGSSSRYTIDDEFDASPVKTKTKLTAALHCLGDQLEKNLDNPGAYIFMVRDITDGTIKNNYSNDGPLSDAGRIQLISILTAHTKPGYGVVLDEYPLMLKPVVNEQVGLNRFGVPSKNNLDFFISGLTEFTNTKRKEKGMAEVGEVIPLIIDGSFTRYDSSHIRSKGYGKNAGYRGDIEDERSASVDFGNSGSERSITLVVNVIDPKNNVVVGTEGFDLKFYSNSKTARFRVAVDEYYYGFSNTDVKVETVHTAQQTLLEAVAIWILDNAYGGMVDFSPCFDTREKLALGRDARSDSSKAQSVALLAPGEGAKATGLNSLANLAPTVLQNGGGGGGGTPSANTKSQPAKTVSHNGNKLNGAGPVKNPGGANYNKTGWQVRAGTYCKPMNANAIYKLLNRSGYAIHATPVNIDPCRGTRVWLGPFSEKTTAEKISADLKAFTGEKGYIVRPAK